MANEKTIFQHNQTGKKGKNHKGREEDEWFKIPCFLQERKSIPPLSATPEIRNNSAWT